MRNACAHVCKQSRLWLAGACGCLIFTNLAFCVLCWRYLKCCIKEDSTQFDRTRANIPMIAHTAAIHYEGEVFLMPLKNSCH